MASATSSWLSGSGAKPVEQERTGFSLNVAVAGSLVAYKLAGLV